jgi:hypothetical protein
MPHHAFRFRDSENLRAAPPLGHEFLLIGLGVDEHHIAVTVLGILQGLPRADRDDANLDSGLLGEERQDVLEQPRVLG